MRNALIGTSTKPPSRTCYHTSTEEAPWFVIPADNKWFARLAVSEAICAVLDGLDLAYPEVSKEKKAELQKFARELEAGIVSLIPLNFSRGNLSPRSIDVARHPQTIQKLTPANIDPSAGRGGARQRLFVELIFGDLVQLRPIGQNVQSPALFKK